MENANRGDGVDRRRLLKGGAALTGAAYVAPAVLNTAVAGASTTTCYVYGVDGDGCSALIESLDGLDGTVATALMGAATDTLDTSPCTANPAGLVAGNILGFEDATFSVASNCSILAVAVGVGRAYFFGVAAAVGDGYDVTSTLPNGVTGGIRRPDGNRQRVTVSVSGGFIDSLAVTVCCTGSP